MLDGFVKAATSSTQLLSALFTGYLAKGNGQIGRPGRKV
jgi:hypothetical protein